MKTSSLFDWEIHRWTPLRPANLFTEEFCPTPKKLNDIAALTQGQERPNTHWVRHFVTFTAGVETGRPSMHGTAVAH
jgi:hypothetical protein